MRHSSITAHERDNYRREGEDLPTPTIHEAKDPIAWVIFAGATGVPSGYYKRFAEYLTKQKFSTITFEYSGAGTKKTAKSSRSTYYDWVFADIPEMIKLTKSKADNLPVFYIGHSVGAHVTGVTSDWQSITAAIRICTTSGYYKYTKKPFSVGIRLILIPLVTWLFGYFPGPIFKLGTNTPKAVACEWAKWCKSPGFGHSKFLRKTDESTDGNYEIIKLQFPILDIDITDDDFCTEKSKNDIDRFYQFDNREILELQPTNEIPIKHMGLFRQQNARHWPKIALWMTEQIRSRQTRLKSSS